VVTPVAVEGAGWYDEGTNVTLSVQSTSAPFGGFLGMLGGNWVFQSWIEDQQTITNSTTLLVTMNSPRVVRVAWKPDYRSPLIMLALITTLAAFVLYNVSTKSIAQRRRRKGTSKSLD
jgi:hypothetical protein